MRVHRTPIPSLALALALVAGCNGDGHASVPLTPANAEPVASLMLQGIGFTSDLVDILDDWWFVIEESLESGSYPCEGGGSVTLSVVDVAPIGQLSAGDRVTLDFFDCVPDDTEDLELTGRYSFFINSMNVAGPGPLVNSMNAVISGFEIDLSYTLTNLRLTYSDGNIVFNGNLRATRSTNDNTNYEEQVRIGSLRATIDAPFGNFEQEISNAILEDHWNDIDDDWIAWFEGTFFDSTIGGKVDVTTPVAFEGTGDDPPDAGVIEARGAGNSLLRIIVLDETNVRLEVDNDGNGIIDESIDTTWDDLSLG